MFLFLMPETPRFLISQKKYEKARQVFKIMAKTNGVDEDRIDNFVFVTKKQQDTSASPASETNSIRSTSDSDSKEDESE